MNKTLLVILIMMMTIPTMGLGFPNTDNLEAMIEKHITISLDKGEEDEVKREEIIDIIMDVEDKESRKELIGLMEDLRFTLTQEDKNHIENSRKLLDDHNESKIEPSEEEDLDNISLNNQIFIVIIVTIWGMGLFSFITYYSDHR